MRSLSLALVAGTLSRSVIAQQFKLGTNDEILASAKLLAADMKAYYPGEEPGKTLGILPGPPADGKGDYYWYIAGAMFGTFVDYWHYTGDTQYNAMTMAALQFQSGELQNYEPRNWTLSLGNDDQAFWAMSALLAAETGFPDPPKDKPSWLDLASNAWNMQHGRWDMTTCNGGLHWQVPQTNGGYDYKNTVANAGYMNLGARLARYTGNNTYMDGAEMAWNWMWDHNLIDHDSWFVYDGVQSKACGDVVKQVFSANAGLLIEACAFLYNYTKDQKWGDRFDKLLAKFLEHNFPNNIAFETSCENNEICTTDQKCFKGYQHRWLAVASQLVEGSRDKIRAVLKTSINQGIKQCTGGPSGRKCGMYWKKGVYVDPEQPGPNNSAPGTTGACETMNVFGAVSALLVDNAKMPLTVQSGGKGENPDAIAPKKTQVPITTASKAGAGIITILILGIGLAPFVWMITT